MNSFVYLYIDESGDLGEFGSKYFTVAAISVTDPKCLERIIKRLRQRKLKKNIKQLPELKANASPHEVREYVLGKVKGTDCQIFAIVIEKSKNANQMFKVQNKLYNYLCGLLMEHVITPQHKLIITIDKKYANTLMREDFNDYIKKVIGAKDKGLKVEIYHRVSHACTELQVVDFVAWAINRKFNTSDDFYYNIIENKIENKDKMIIRI